MNNYNPKKISLAEATSNDNGKTSGSGFIGFLTGVIGALVFLCTAICLYFHVEGITIELVDKSITLIGISAVLLGVRKISPFISNSNNTKVLKNIEENSENK